MLPDSLQVVHLLWGLLALPIIALYYWTLRRQREEVATFALWNKALARRSPWAKWRRMVSLAVQLTVLVLLVLAVAQLDWSPFARNVRTVVLVVDTSASMKANDEAPSRFAKSLATARKIVSGLGRDERGAILSAGSTPGILCGLTGDKTRLRQSLDALTCTDEPGSVEPALELAERMLGKTPHATIVLLTDGRFDGVQELASRKNLQVLVAAGKANNVALTRLVARPSLIATEHEVLLEAANFSDQAKTVQVALSLGEKKLDSVSLDIPPQGRAQKAVSVAIAAGGLLAARIEPADDFPADDTATALVAPRGEMNGLLVGNELSPLAAVLQRLPRLKLQVTPDASQTLAKADVTILDGPTPRELPAGGVLAIAPAGSCDLWDEAGTLEGRVIVKSQSGEAPLSGLDFSSVVLEDLVRLKFKEPARTLVETASGDPLVSVVERPAGRVLVWHARLDKSDLAQRAIFPLFVAQTVRWLGESADSDSVALRTGERMVLSATKESMRLQAPSGALRELPAELPGSAELDQAGVWQIVSGDAPSAVVPVNLFSPSESDLTSGGEISSGETPASRALFSEPLWTAFLIAALFVSLLDWYFLYRRTLV